jgi:hypothetical protein
MKYEFLVSHTVVLDSADYDISNADEARELLEQGFGDSYNDVTQIQLVHVGHGKEA